MFEIISVVVIVWLLIKILKELTGKAQEERNFRDINR